MQYLLALIIPFFSFVLQSYPRLFNRYFGVDVWTRLIEIEHVRRARHKIPGRITSGFIIDGYFDYPILFPWLFSFLNKRFLLKIQGFVSPFFDTLQNIFVFFVAYSLTSDIKISLMAQLVYSLIPIIPIENSYLTPRSFGYFLFTLSFYPALLFHIYQDLNYLILSIIFTTATFLTHRFAIQSLLFIFLFFTFIDKSLFYLGVLFLGFIAATIATRGHYLRVLRGHLANIYFWVRNFKYRFAHQIYWNKKGQKVDWVGRVYTLLSIFPPLFLLGINVWAFSGFIYIYFYYFTPFLTLKNEIFLKLALWIAFFYVIGSIILKIKRLIPIGEGQRYLEMATVPTSIISSILFFEIYNKYGFAALVIFILLCMGNLALILFAQIKGIIRDKNRSLTPDLKKVFNFINRLKGTKAPRIMCIPHQITTMTVYNTKADVLVNADNPGLLKITDFYPILKKPIPKLAKEYKLDYLILRENYCKINDLKLKKARVVFREKDSVLIKL